MNNASPGRAQVKIFVTCLEKDTGARDGHAHPLVVTGPVTDDETPVPPDTIPPGTHVLNFLASCPDGSVPVSPGFTVVGGTARLTASHSLASEQTWNWAFATESPVTSIQVEAYCVSRTTGAATSGPAHTHQVDADLRPRHVEPGPFGSHEVVALGEYSDHRITARPHDEGNVGAFRINAPDQVWYLGQDAQGQVRGFRFVNLEPGPTAMNAVDLGVWGFDKRTTKNS